MDTAYPLNQQKWYPFSRQKFQSSGSKISRWDLGIVNLDSEVYLESQHKNVSAQTNQTSEISIFTRSWISAITNDIFRNVFVNNHSLKKNRIRLPWCDLQNSPGLRNIVVYFSNPKSVSYHQD